MDLRNVNSKQLINQFHQLPFDIYNNDPNWIPPLRQEIERIFDRKYNKYFIDGDAIRFVLFDDEKPVGRIAAFYRRKNLKGTIKNGGIGFVECIDDVKAAKILFDASETWLIEKGCNAIDGPVNFGERDRWWGLLVEGFEPPMYGMNYHLPYYRKLFESNGFKNYFEQYTFVVDRNDKLPPIIEKIGKRLVKNRKIEFRSPEKHQLKKYAADFVAIYNQSWAEHIDVQPITYEQSLQLMKDVKPIMDPYLFIFAYWENEPVGFFIAVPDANQIVKYANGNMNLIGKLNILLHRPFIKLEHVCGLIFGVVPQCRNKGIEGGMVARMQEIMNASRYYKRIELLWIGDFNKKMLNFVRHINAKKYRSLITYRKILDDQIPFERCPSL